VPVVAAAANFERRAGARPSACAIYHRALGAEDAQDGTGRDGLVLSYVGMLWGAYGDAEEARRVLAAELEARPGARAVWEAAAFFEQQAGGPGAPGRVLALYRAATAAPAEPSSSAADGASPAAALPFADRAELSRRAIEFADECCDAAAALELRRHHATHYGLPPAAAEAAAKRARAEDGGGGGGQGGAKQARTEADAAAAAAAASAGAGAYAAEYAAAAAAAAVGTYAFYSQAAYPYGSYPYGSYAAAAGGGYAAQ